MKTSLLQRLDLLLERHEELEHLLASQEIIEDQNRFRDYSKEYAQLSPLVTCYGNYRQYQVDLDNAKLLLTEEDDEIRALAESEINQLQEKILKLESELKVLLLPKDPDDQRNVFLEIRAGTGGDEAAIFVGDLARMYMRYAENLKWQLQIMSANPGEHGGYKEIIMKIVGNDVYANLKFESGAHRVQRVPETESQGRVHTSACTVAIMPEVAELDEISIDLNDCRIDTYRSSGAGGQHVNTTDSAIRITHLPTGIVVECQDERSQHKNKARALSLLQAKILDHERSQQKQHEAETRRLLVGSGDRSQRIRTYNYPQGRVTDHRINLTLYKLSEIMEGNLGMVIDPLIQEFQAEQLMHVGDD